MENNGQDNGKVTETYRALPGQAMWAMINPYLAHVNGVATQFRFTSNEGIEKTPEKIGSNAMTYADLTGTPEAIKAYIKELSRDGAGKYMQVFENDGLDASM